VGRYPGAQVWHGVTAAVAAFALAAQLVLVIDGASVLVTEEPPSLAQRLVHFVSYFTVLTNVLVCAVTITLARRPDRDGPGWRVLRLSGVTGIVVTGIVHWFFLRPLLHLTGWSYATDLLLHVVVPILALVGWLVFGPRPRVVLRVVLASLLYPVLWLVYTLVAGAVSGWYPYPFLDVDRLGGARVALACVGVTAAILAVSVLLWWGNRLLPPTHRAEARSRAGSVPR
jgi:hypothetical protein